MLEALSLDYRRGWRKAKGLARRLIVVDAHAPAAALPVVTLGGLAYANLLTGAVTSRPCSPGQASAYAFLQRRHPRLPGHHGRHRHRGGDLRSW